MNNRVLIIHRHKKTSYSNQLQPLNVAVDIGVQMDFDYYIKGLRSLKLYTSSSKFSHHNGYSLTKNEFHKQDKRFQHTRSKTLCVECFFVIYAGADFIKESMLIFDRSKEQKYDVLVAEVITQRGLNPER